MVLEKRPFFINKSGSLNQEDSPQRPLTPQPFLLVSVTQYFILNFNGSARANTRASEVPKLDLQYGSKGVSWFRLQIIPLQTVFLVVLHPPQEVKFKFVFPFNSILSHTHTFCSCLTFSNFTFSAASFIKYENLHLGQVRVGGLLVG